MTYRTFKVPQDIEAVDVQTMAGMSKNQYREYLDGGLLFIDHHEILRSQPAGYPIATTKAQLAELIAFLNSIESKMRAD